MRIICPHCGTQNEVSRGHPESLPCRRCEAPLAGTASVNSASASPESGNWRDETLIDALMPGESSAQARLVLEEGLDGDETWPLAPVNDLGRHPKNHIVLNDREISKEHACIELRGDRWWILDKQSSNGTFVNGEPIAAKALTHGDRIQLGAVVLCFATGALAEAAAGDLVTIVPETPADSTYIHATLETAKQDFRPAAEVEDLDELRRDYEKLRLSHELSRVSITADLSTLLSRTLEMVFSMFPADNAVIMLVDEATHRLVPHLVRHRDGLKTSREVVLSSTMVNGAIRERTSILASDAFLDPRFSAAQSIIAHKIRAAMCVPLISHDRVLGLLHVDSRERIGVFGEKDLQILQAIAAQTATAIENVRLFRQVEEDTRTRDQLSRFLSPHVVEEMLHNKGRVTKGGREIQASVVFCDIRGFTRIAEASGPQELVDLLNVYFERLVEVVFKRNGVLDKFIGDALMATWGTMGEPDIAKDTLQCVTAAVEFRDTIRELNEERKARGETVIAMGVGVNTGTLVAGYMGSRRRLEFTVIGDTVNTASRICGLAKGDQVIISDATYRQVADRIEARYLERRKVKGREQGVDLYEVERILPSA